MSNFGKIISQEFIDQYWQQKVCLLSNAFTNTQGLISGPELAGLACEEFIQSRLVSANLDQSDWDCQYSPFEESAFTSLNEQNWTLLVQGVDLFFRKVKDLLNNFDFLPAWRMDDVMVSYATPGGGVGPHFDYYDVFLIQTSGTREWKIGQTCSSSSKLRDHPDLKLLQEFNESEKHVLNAGDVLYIPAGVAHWGTALSEDCITASVGFRAPSYRELVLGAVESIADGFREDQRYTDPVNSKTNDPYLISQKVENRIADVWDELDRNTVVQNLIESFSVQVTEPRDEDVFDDAEFTTAEIKVIKLEHHPASRFAYRTTPDGVILYANGYSYPTDLDTATAICHSDYLAIEKLDWDLIRKMTNLGYLIKP